MAWQRLEMDLAEEFSGLARVDTWGHAISVRGPGVFSWPARKAYLQRRLARGLCIVCNTPRAIVRGRLLRVCDRHRNNHEGPRRCTRARLLTIDGTTRRAVDWAADVGVSSSLYYHRVKAGWAPVAAALTPPNPRRSAAKKSDWLMRGGQQ
jgi:hypothetical protein